MKILFTICARAGSKGVKNKNIRKFLDQPLPYYTASIIELFTEKYRGIHEIDTVVNTDSLQLKELLDKTTLELFYVDRKEVLGTDTASKLDVIRDTIRIMKEDQHKQYDIVVDLDLTSPLRKIEDIENIINTLILNNKIDIVFSVTKARRNPYFNMVKKNEEGFYSRVIDSDFNYRQQTPEVFDMNASIYGYRSEFLLSSNKGLFEGSIEVTQMQDTAILDIDDEEDLEFMQVIAEYLYRNNEGLSEIKTNIACILKTNE